MRDRKKKTIVLSIMALVAVGLSVGFAAFSSSLTLSTNVGVNPDASTFSVVFSTKATSEDTSGVVPTKNPTTLSATNGVIENTLTPTISNLGATFTQPGQSVTYKFYAYNKGEYLAYLNSITFLPIFLNPLFFVYCVSNFDMRLYCLEECGIISLQTSRRLLNGY